MHIEIVNILKDALENNNSYLISDTLGDRNPAEVSKIIISTSFSNSNYQW